MLGLFLIISALDLIGVGLVGPFIAAIVSNTDLFHIEIIGPLLLSLGMNDRATAIEIFGAVLIVFYAVKALVAFVVHTQIFRFSFRFRGMLLNRLVDAYLWMPYQFHLERSSAGLIQSTINDTKSLADDLLIPALRLTSDSIVMVAIAVLLFFVNWQAMVMATLILGSALGFYAGFVRPHMRAAGERSARTNERIIKWVNQTIWGIKEVRILRAEDDFMRHVAAASAENAGALTRFYSLMTLPRYLMEAVVVIFLLLLALYTVVSHAGGTNLVPLLAMFAVAGLRILPGMISMGGALASINYASHSLHNVYADLRYLEDHMPQRPQRAGPPPVPVQRVAFEDVRFGYKGAERAALDGVSLEIRRGQSVGFIGESGAGKTTLIDMLLGFHAPQSGAITLDGVEISQYGWDAWRQQVAYIPQNVALLDDTLEANIVFGRDVALIDRVKLAEAIESAQLKALVARLPEGLQTMIGERGIRLSGGERQRIALARGFYFDRDFFVLDEATAALDNATERQVIEVIEKFHGRKTMIVIAHRLTTVKACDVIYRMRAGQIIESGDYAQVVDGSRV